MSGGVDSSVAAALLKKAGFNVVGVFMKFWKEPGEQGENKCCSLKAETDARRVATKLEIPFYVFDFKKEFKKNVVDYFIDDYRLGNTPNPCVECNQYIKFGMFVKKALSMGADYIATGHYARVEKYQKGKQTKFKLLTAKDIKKDQSYFLWTLNQGQLSKSLFPIGEYTKDQVRVMAKKWKLLVFDKKDSQEVCFVKDKNICEFLRKRISVKPGIIVSTEKKELGKHNGLAFYTIGQRKGLNIGGTGPYYVVKKDLRKNKLVVAKAKDDSTYTKEVRLKNVKLISGDKLRTSIKCFVKIRYSSDLVLATIRSNKIIFSKKQKAVTPGQSAVFYSTKLIKGMREVLGGGIIK